VSTQTLVSWSRTRTTAETRSQTAALGLGWVIRRITNVGRNSRAAAYCAEMVNDDTPAPPRYPVRGQWQWGVMRMSEHWGFGAIRRLWRLLRPTVAGFQNQRRSSPGPSTLLTQRPQMVGCAAFAPTSA